MAKPILIPLRAVHVATDHTGGQARQVAVLEPAADESMSMLEVHAEDFLEQMRPLLRDWFDEVDLERCTMDEVIGALGDLPERRLVLSLFPGGGWELKLRSTAAFGPRSFARLERRATRRAAPAAETRLSIADMPNLTAPVLDVSEDGSGLALDCDADELRALLMEGALREPGAHPIEIQVVRVQAIGNGRYRVGCVVGRGRETARGLLS